MKWAASTTRDEGVEDGEREVRRVCVCIYLGVDSQCVLGSVTLLFGD